MPTDSLLGPAPVRVNSTPSVYLPGASSLRRDEVLLFVPSCYILFFPIQDRVMTATSLKEKAREELRIYAIVAAYLYVCFAALLVFESSLQPEPSGGFVPHGIAVIKALVLGKFLLLGRAVGAGTRVHTRTVAGRIVDPVRFPARRARAPHDAGGNTGRLDPR